MEIIGLRTPALNQNNYNNNQLTPEFVGSLIVYPINFSHPKCLPCDGFVLKRVDYEQLFSVIGTQFNDGSEAQDEFRIPDYTEGWTNIYLVDEDLNILRVPEYLQTPVYKH